MFNRKFVNLSTIVLIIIFNSQSTVSLEKLLGWDFGNDPNNPFCDWQIQNYASYQIVENHLELCDRVYTTTFNLNLCYNSGPSLHKTLSVSEQDKTVDAKYLFIEKMAFNNIHSAVSLIIKDSSGAVFDYALEHLEDGLPQDYDVIVVQQDNGTIKVDISSLLSGGKKITQISFYFEGSIPGIFCDCGPMVDRTFKMDKIYIARATPNFPPNFTPIFNLLLD